MTTMEVTPVNAWLDTRDRQLKPKAQTDTRMTAKTGTSVPDPRASRAATRAGLDRD